MHYRLAEGLEAIASGHGVALRTAHGKLPLALADPGAVAAFAAMGEGGIEAGEARGRSGDMEFLSLLRVLGQQGALERVWHGNDDNIAAIARPLKPEFEEAPEDALSRHPLWRMSRFVLMRRNAEGALVVESPLGHTMLSLYDTRLAEALLTLTNPVSPEFLHARFDALAADDASTLLAVLACEGVIFPADADGRLDEDDDVALRQWEVADLYMHSRSRMGRHANPAGGVFPFVGDLEWEPRRKPAPAGQVIPLSRARLDLACVADPPFQAVAEQRHSVRAYGPRPPDAVLLGQFLDRAARTRAELPGPYGGMGRHTYANGGASYELELYLNIDQCLGLSPGFYHYDPDNHALVMLSAPTPDTRQMLQDAYTSAANLVWPQMVIHVAARFQRVQWKYRSISYAVVLRNTGALYQHFYMVATAMGLGPCGLGVGNSDLFARVAGTDYLRESSVGEFLIGNP